jgi:ArsR family transcriptional regulator, arsenate/arsenite/antimonite-responsive transcriptional repressor
MESSDVVTALAALAQESRLAVYRLLVRRGPDGYNPSEILQHLDIPAPTLSFHLKELQRAELVVSRRAGRFLHYSANFEHMQQVLDFLTENCCSLAQDCDTACKPAKRAAPIKKPVVLKRKRA